VPYIGFLTAFPDAYRVDSFGRYFVAPSVLACFFVASELIRMDRRVQRQALAVGALSMTVWMGADLLGWIKPSRPFHLRPIETARNVFTHAETLARLTPVQRIQWLEQGDERMGFAGLLGPLLNEPLPAGDVFLFTSPATNAAAAGSYVHVRLVYLLYPHRVYVVDNDAALDRALADSPAALVVYAARPPLDRVAGEVRFKFGDRYAVIRAPRLKP